MIAIACPRFVRACPRLKTLALRGLYEGLPSIPEGDRGVIFATLSSLRILLGEA
jgi:hypothetical protein